MTAIVEEQAGKARVISDVKQIHVCSERTLRVWRENTMVPIVMHREDWRRVTLERKD